MARSSMFYCFMCFVVGACLGVFVIVVASCPQKKTLLGWVAYLLVVLALAYRIGGALLL